VFKFDYVLWLLTRYLALRAGEKLIDQLDSVEDTKGNKGERGTFFALITGRVLSVAIAN